MDIPIPIPNFSDSDSDSKETPKFTEIDRTSKIYRRPIISCEKLADMIEKPESYEYDSIYILDARYGKEFNKSHIKGARNVINDQQVMQVYNLCKSRNCCVICYSDESRRKSYEVYKMLRPCDFRNGPFVDMTISSLYILDGDYKTFYQKYPQLCVSKDDHNS